MKKVTMYQANDGSLHETQEAALHHERKADLADWLLNSDIDWRDANIREVAGAALHWMDRRDAPDVEASK